MARRQDPPLSPVTVPLWSISCGLDWTIVPALTKHHAELLMLGHYIEAGQHPDIRFRIHARRATQKDLARCQAFAQAGVLFDSDDAPAAQALVALAGQSPPAADEPDQLLLFAGS